jgi:5'-deoxynucleotidase YfbR-like HD superfamily hydrolase
MAGEEPVNLNIREMIAGNPIRLRYVFRYSTSRVSCPESVAEHSFFVAFYSMLIGEWVIEATLAQHSGIKKPDRMFDWAELLKKALLHDLEEARSGDVPRPFKYSSPELRMMLEAASRAAFVQVLTPVIGPPHEAAPAPENQFNCEPPSGTHSLYLQLWETAKDDSIEGRIIAFADFLAVLGFMLQECNAGGNKSIWNHVHDMDVYFQGFLRSDFDFIRPLVDQAADLMEEVFPDE